MCDELETQVLDDAENYIKKRAAAASVMKEMKPRGGLLRKPVRHHLKPLLRILMFHVALDTSCITPIMRLAMSLAFICFPNSSCIRYSERAEDRYADPCFC